MIAVLTHPVVRSAIAGALAAAVVDIHAFMSWKSFNDAARYNWSTATFRWLQGAVAGMITGMGLSQ